MKRLAAAALLAVAAGGCGGRGARPHHADHPPRPRHQGRRLHAGQERRAGQARHRVLHDPAADRHAADEVQARLRPAHGHAPDLRPRRPVDDHPPPSARRRRRHDRRLGHVPGSPAATASSSTLYPERSPGSQTQLPALPAGHGRGRRTSRSRCRRSRRSPVVDGYRFTIEGRRALKAIQAALPDVTVTDPHGKPGHVHALTTARSRTRSSSAPGSLDYFHTHVCAPGATRLHEHPRRHAGHRHARRRPAS